MITSILQYRPPNFYQKTRHIHWQRDPGGIMESSGINDGYFPEACTASDQTGDPEVMLVSILAPYGDSYVYWNIEGM
jgi:hypothetical protein